jgi:hypothetical protein
MSDIEKKPEQPVVPEQPMEHIGDLPDNEITDKDAEAVKGGSGGAGAGKIKFNTI